MNDFEHLQNAANEAGEEEVQDQLFGVEADEEPLVVSHARQSFGQINCLPSQFTQYAFRMPDDSGAYQPFSFVGRQHLLRPYDTPGRRILFFASRQTEKSTLLGNTCLSYMALIPGYRVLYVSPSSLQTKTFSKDRIHEPLHTSPILGRLTNAQLSRNIYELQLTNRSKITLRYAFLSADRSRGIPAYRLAIDEIQDILQDHIPVLESCLSHAPAELRTTIYGGTPKTIGNNIEYYRAVLSTQAEWAIPCDAHGGETGRYWNVLGEKNIGKQGPICEACGRPIDCRHVDAQWAIQVPDAPIESYRINQLMVPWVDWDALLYQYETWPRAKFYNEVLAVSADSGQHPINMAQIKACCNEDVFMGDLARYRTQAYDQPIFGGIDWGCHDDQTRILTKRGWLYQDELSETDEVMQYWPDGRLEWVKPLRIVRYQHDGPMMLLSGPPARTSANLCCTLDHKILFRPFQRNRSLKSLGWQVGVAADLFEYQRSQLPDCGDYRAGGLQTISLPGENRPLVMQPNDYLQLLPYLLSFGYVVDDTLHFAAQQHLNGVGELCALLRRYGVAMHRWSGWHIVTKDERLVRWGRKHLKPPVWSGIDWRAGDNDVPDHVWRANKEELRILIDFYLRYWRVGNVRLMESLLALSVLAGLPTRLGRQKSGLMRLYVPGQRQLATSRTLQVVPYSGTAWCVQVPSGFFVTEREGVVSYQGNTGENTYTVVTLATYVGSKFRVFYAHRFTGEETTPELQMDRLVKLFRYFNVRVIGADYGGGFDRNDLLIRKFGITRVHRFQYAARPRKKVTWSPQLRRWIVHRTEVMSDVFNAIKRGRDIEFPRWEEWRDPYATDMVNIFSEYSYTMHMLKYDHPHERPDDTFHSLVVCLLGSMVVHPRPDIIVPQYENERAGQPLGITFNEVDQG